MEDFFKQPVLEKIYDLLSVEFEESLLNDENEYKKYHNIIDEEEKLYKIMEDIVGKDEDKLNKLMSIIRELEYYCCKETEYWNKKYFNLGFTYMIGLRIPETFSRLNMDRFSSEVHSFLDNLRETNISNKQKELLFTFVNDLKEGTEKQKRRFLLFYNLNPNSNKILSYNDIGEMEGCSGSAIKNSVFSIESLLVRLENEQKEIFTAIMKSCKKS